MTNLETASINDAPDQIKKIEMTLDSNDDFYNTYEELSDAEGVVSDINKLIKKFNADIADLDIDGDNKDVEIKKIAKDLSSSINEFLENSEMSEKTFFDNMNNILKNNSFFQTDAFADARNKFVNKNGEINSLGAILANNFF